MFSISTISIIGLKLRTSSESANSITLHILQLVIGTIFLLVIYSSPAFAIYSITAANLRSFTFIFHYKISHHLFFISSLRLSLCRLIGILFSQSQSRICLQCCLKTSSLCGCLLKRTIILSFFSIGVVSNR